MRVRKGTLKDLPQLIDLSIQLNLEHARDYSGYPKLAKDSPKERTEHLRKIFRKYFKSLLGKKNSVFFVAEERGELIGSVLGKEGKDPPVFKETRIGYIGDFYVKPGFRGKGVGKKLFAELKKWFRQKKFRHIEIGYYSQNKKAKKLYLGMGFRPHKEILRMKI
jgi:ribosomal protein S18 acetylase RimI-like enzyme